MRPQQSFPRRSNGLQERLDENPGGKSAPEKEANPENGVMPWIKRRNVEESLSAPFGPLDLGHGWTAVLQAGWAGWHKEVR